MSSKKLPGPDLDKIFFHIGNIILFPFIWISRWTHPYNIEHKKYHANLKCYCGSNLRHRICCGPVNERKGLTAYTATKTHKRTHEITTYIDVIKTKGDNKSPFRYDDGLGAYDGGDAIDGNGLDF